MKKWWRKCRWKILGITLLFILYFATRLIRLPLRFLPPFTDEAIYAEWIQLGRYEPAQRLVSLSDGKQPLFIWLGSLLMNFVGNPFLVGRLTSVLAGAITLIGLFLLVKQLFKDDRIGLTAMLLYVLYPFALVHDRMALYDTLVGTLSIWSLNLAILLVRELSLAKALVLALILGAGILNKSSGFLNLYLLPTTLVLIPRKLYSFKIFLKWLSTAAVAIGLALLYYQVLRLSPQFYLVAAKNQQFANPLGQLLESSVWQSFPERLVRLTNWLITYLTWPLVLSAGAALYWPKRRREKLLLLLWFALPFLGLSVLGRLSYPRFIFFMTLPLLVLAAWGLVGFVHRLNLRIFPSFGFWILSLSLLLFADYKILTDFAHAPLPRADLDQYINGSTAGGGMREIMAYLLTVAASGQELYIAAEGTFGSLPLTMVNIYFSNHPNVARGGLPSLPTQIPSDLLDRAKKMPVYLILNQTQITPVWPLRLIAQYRKGSGNYYVRLYRVIR